MEKFLASSFLLLQCSGLLETVFMHSTTPIRRPNEPEKGSRTNKFFVDFYRSGVEDMHGLEAHEHTAQVSTKNVRIVKKNSEKANCQSCIVRQQWNSE